MFRIPKEWLPIFLILALCQGTKGLKPEMLPEDPELYINEGDSLELSCTSTDEIRFYYPDIKTELYGMLTSPTELKTSSSGNTTIFRRPKAIHGDTGWYGCANHDVNVIAAYTGRYDQPDVNWKYVYVKSNTHWFVRNDIQILKAVVGNRAAIPCRTTSPDYKVVLTNIDYPDINLSFDPKIGFIIEKSKLQNDGLYICKITIGDVIQSTQIHLKIIKTPVLTEPRIINDTLRHVTKGQKLQVNCTIDVDADLRYHFTWTNPKQDNRIITQPPKEPTESPNQYRATTTLTIENVTYEDTGEYECSIITDRDAFTYYRKSAKTFITIYDPAITYINLTLEGINQTYERNIGDEVQWVVSVDAYPNAKLLWLHPNGDPIKGSLKRDDDNKVINVSSTSTTLKIKNIHLVDSGTYTLQASNDKDIKMLNITLIVKALPLLAIMDNFENFYMPQQEVKISLQVIAFPAPNITCIFRKKPNTSSEGSEDIPITILEDPSVNSDFMFDVTMTMNASDTGNVTCTACNVLGCDNATEPLFVSDVPGGFGIIEPTLELTDGDDLKVTCAASIYNFTNVEWLDKDGQPLRDSDGVTIAYRQTRFTNRSELHIHPVRNADNGSHYFCSAMIDNGYTKLSEYYLNIAVPQKPYFWKTNMNETEIDLDLSTEGHKTVELKCHTKGVPAPNVTWYKDDTPIKESEQYIFFDKNQELHIQYLLEENSGKYKCKAENRIGKEEKWLTLTIIGKGIPKALIYSIVVLVAVCVILVIYFSIKMHREKVMRKQLMEAGLTHFEEGALECLNPELTVDDQAELLPYDKKWEFPRERLKFGKQLGFGAFGVVMKAEARGICDDETVTTVAVKMVRRSTESTYIRALASELKIMVHLGKHLNVVNLLGACTKNITKRELLVIVEYCRFGNLHNYLLRHRTDFINQIDPVSGKIDPTIGLDKLTRTTSVGSNNRLKYTVLSFSRSLSLNSSNSNPGAELVSYTAGTDPQCVSMSPDGCVLSNNSTQPGWRSNYSGDYKDQNLKPICTQDLLSWAFQVARGMEYLSQRKVLHGDLAARNILLAENNVVKICDFGLAKTMYKDDNYKKKGDAPLPIKWMAIESIRDRVFSTQSDIWSFGIVLWEFFTLAKTPYPGMEAEKQYQRLIEGYRMEQPEYATEEVYDIMLQCWKAKPTLRPTFTNLVANIGDLLEEGVKEHYVDLNAPYLDMNTMVLESGKDDYLTMMSAPDHDALSSPTSLYVNTPCQSPRGTQEDSYLAMSPSSPGSESGIFSPRVTSNNSKFDFPMNDITANINSDSESEAVEISPMLAQEEDNYLKPINVHERRAEFARQRQAQKVAAKMEKDNESDSGYCNTPRNLHLIDLNDANLHRSEMDGIKRTEEKNSTKHAKDYVPPIIRTQDNYVNMPQQKDDLRKDAPVSFSNPSYVMMGNRNFEQAKV